MREMKDSKVAWIGSIPENWNVIKFSSAINRIGTGLNPRENFELDKESSFYYVTIRNFKNGQLFLDDNCDRINEKAFRIIQERSKLEIGDILFASISKDGQVYLLKEKPTNWNINESVFCIKPKKEIYDSVYLCYHLTDYRFYESLLTDATGSTFLSIKQNKLKQSNCVLPPILEQQKIATYLDTQCSKVDTLIANQQSQIEKLKSYKQSLITEVVTKGLDKHVPMKDSGVEWIGEIPCDWQISKVRYIGTLQNGLSKGGEYFGEGYPFVSYGDIYKNYELPKNVSGLVKTDEKERENYSVKQGDIFFTRTSETIEEVGFSCVCKKTIENATFAGFVIRLRPYKKDDIILTEFAKYYFRGTQIRAYLIKEMNLVTRASLGQTLLKSMSVTAPPLDEQKRISEYLDTKCLQIDDLISIKQQKITYL